MAILATISHQSNYRLTGFTIIWYLLRVAVVVWLPSMVGMYLIRLIPNPKLVIYSLITTKWSCPGSHGSQVPSHPSFRRPLTGWGKTWREIIYILWPK
ncbi:hypothetical protein LX36DRAFT_655855 [Colletotrichum falcatum]|nr:hypothetical protein LX36DRAFT_655855 [Colletotrichum falcatum]